MNMGSPIIVSTHPRTKSKMETAEVAATNDGVSFLPPFGFFDFISLEQGAFCILSDSGTVQEECCIFKVPNVTIRDVTERPETVECGSNILSGAESESILRCVRTALGTSVSWSPPPEYMATNVSDTVARIALGYQHR